jgi:hypothetical protein
MAVQATKDCSKCGYELSTEDQFCSSCGQPFHPTAHMPTSGAAVPVLPPPAGGGDAAVAQAPPQEMLTNYGGESNLPPPTSVAYEQMVWGQGVVVTDMTSDQVLEQAATHMASRGFAIESRQGNAINFSFREGPDAFLGVVLLLLFILPGILYFLLSGGDRRTTMLVNEESEGCRVVYISGDGGAPLYALRDWALSLPGSVIIDPSAWNWNSRKFAVTSSAGPVGA